MNQRANDTPEQVLKFAPKEKAKNKDAQLDDAGQAILSQIRPAADLSKEDSDRAMSLAHKLSMELRAAEDRTHQREAARSEINLRRRGARNPLTYSAVPARAREKARSLSCNFADCRPPNIGSTMSGASSVKDSRRRRFPRWSHACRSPAFRASGMPWAAKRSLDLAIEDNEKCLFRSRTDIR